MADVIIRLDDVTKEDFQIYCIRQKTSMQEVLSNYVSELMKKQSEKQRRRTA
jgi:hypothetical protein